MNKIENIFIIVLAVIMFAGCHRPENGEMSWIEEETYAGGKLGTTFNNS